MCIFYQCYMFQLNQAHSSIHIGDMACLPGMTIAYLSWKVQNSPHFCGKSTTGTVETDNFIGKLHEKHPYISAVRTHGRVKYVKKPFTVREPQETFSVVK